MNRLLSLAFSAGCVLAVGSLAKADVVSFPLTSPLNLTTTNTTSNVSYPAQTNGGLSTVLRGFYVGGVWAGAVGSPWSNELRVSLLPGTVDRLNGGNPNTSGFTFGTTFTNTFNNFSAPNDYNGDLYTGPNLNVAGTLQVALRQTFAGSTATLTTGQIVLFTDGLAPIAGTIVGGPTYQRADSCTGIGAGTLAAGTSFRYNSHTFVAPTTGLYMIGADWRQSGGGAFDGWLSLYLGAFNPAAPLTNLTGVDDDGGVYVNVSGVDVPASSVMFVNLTAGQTYTLVPSTFVNGAAGGTYTLYVAGARAATQTISGTITLGSFPPGPSGRQATVQIRPVGTGQIPVQAATVTLDAAGNFSFTGMVPAGTYDVFARADTWLWTARRNVTVSGSGVSGLGFPLLNGDVNQDNIIDGLDLGSMDATFNLGLGDPGFNQHADLNKDGIVDGLDLAILDANFNITGDE